MKGSITSTQAFKYILLFTFLFAAFLALAITYNKVYKLKNETISIIEKYEGIIVSKKTLEIVNNYLRNSGYNIKGQCELGEFGVKDLGVYDYEEVTDARERYYYCLDNTIDYNNNGDKISYKIKLFFKFNLPFIGELFTFRITGETKQINFYDANQELS